MKRRALLTFAAASLAALAGPHAASGAPLWSQPTQTGVIAAPIAYAIDGEQYVAILVGTGSSWAPDTGCGSRAPRSTPTR